MRPTTRLLPLLLLLTSSAWGAVRLTIVSPQGTAIAGAEAVAFRLESSRERTERLLSTKPDPVPLASAASDAKGNVSLDVKDEAVVLVAVRAPGYSPSSVTVVRDEDAGALLLREAELKKGKIATGGKPVSNALVVWSAADGTELAVRTGEDGTYQIPDPAKWAARVLVSHPDYAIAEKDFLGGKPDLDRVLSAGAAVSGRVLSTDGKIGVRARLRTPSGFLLGESSEDGTFALPHVPTDWKMIRIESGDLVGTLQPGKSEVRLARSVSISGTVLDAATQKPVPGAVISAWRGTAMMREGEQRFRSDAKGAYAIEGLLPGTYVIEAWHPAFTFQEAEISVAPREAQRKNLYGLMNGRAAGYVVDSQKKALGAVRIMPAQTARTQMRFFPVRTWETPTSWSAPDGRFVVRRLDPEKEFELLATRKGSPGGRSARFSVSRGETKSGVTIVIPAGIRVTGKVVDSSGRPVRGATVAAIDSEDSGNMRFVVRLGRQDSSELVETAADGTFELTAKEGTYTFNFRSEGFAPRSIRGVAVREGVEPLEVTLTPGAEISGRVVRNDGSGVGDVGVSTFTGSSASQVSTGPDGSFVLEGLEPGPTMLMVMKPEEFIQEQRSVTAPATGVEIRLPAGGRVSGRAFDKATGAPIAEFRAGVTNVRSGPGMRMFGPPMMKDIHSDDGTFVVENIPPGVHEFIVTAPGYVTWRNPSTRVEDGKEVAGLEAAMQSGVTVSGRVTGPDGDPVSGAAATLEQNSDDRLGPAGPQSSASTDSNGEYSIDSLPPGEASIAFAKDGYVTEHKTLKLSGKEAHLDVRLSKGQQVRGVVVTESGAPVAGATVMVRGSVRDAGFADARSDDAGGFFFEGLPPGRYAFTAAKSGLVDATVSDVDIATSGVIRLVMRSGGIIAGRVLGLSDEELASTMVSAMGIDANSGAPADPSGRFRIEGAPTGTVRVFATTGKFGTGRRTSPTKTLDVAPGAEVQVDIEFSNDTLIRGRVTKSGRGLEGASVAFRPADLTARTMSTARTEADGSYQLAGLEDGSYDVIVTDMTTMSGFQTRYTVHGSGNFDIEIPSTGVSGTVVDGDSGEGISGATVTVLASRTSPYANPEAASDAAGRFTIDSVPPGTYQVRARKEGYGQQILDATVTESGGQELTFQLSKTEGITLRIVDGRDGRALQGWISASDPLDRVVYEGSGNARPGGAVRVALAPGNYVISVFAAGYARATLRISAPAPEMRVAMLPGGTVVVESSRPGRIAIKLVSPSGIEYRTRWDGKIAVSPGTNHFENIPSGNWTLIVLDAAGQPERTIPVVVTEGGTTRVEI